MIQEPVTCNLGQQTTASGPAWLLLDLTSIGAEPAILAIVLWTRPHNL